MTPYLSGKGKTYLGRVYDPKAKEPVVRSMGTRDFNEAIEVEAFVERLRKQKRTDVLDLIVGQRLTAITAYEQDALGTLAEHIASLAEAATLAADVDLDPLVTEWNGKGRKSQSDKYVRQVRKMIPDGEPFRRSRFTKGAIVTFLAGLNVDGPTRNRYRAALLQFGRWLVQRDILAANPVRDVDGYPENDPRTVHHSREQAKLLIGLLPSLKYQALEALMAGSAAEWQVCKRARRLDVNVDERTLFAHGGKTRWRKRTIVVTEDWCWKIVERYVRTLHPNAPLFDMSERDALEKHHDAAERAGLEPSTLHDWRHSYTIWNLRDGVEPAFLRPQLGHSPHSTTLERVYGAFIPSPAERRERAKRAADSASKAASRTSRKVGGRRAK